MFCVALVPRSRSKIKKRVFAMVYYRLQSSIFLNWCPFFGEIFFYVDCNIILGRDM